VVNMLKVFAGVSRCHHRLQRDFLAEMAAVRDHVAVNWKNQSGNDFHNFTHLVCLSQSRRACRILWNLVSALPGTFAAEVQMG